MPGTIALVGAGEFLEGMAEVDRHLVGQAPQQPARVVIVPTAAAQEDPRAWTDMGTTHFQRLGAQVEPVFVMDRASANDPEMARQIREANFVYMSGGSPGYLLETIRDSVVWEAMKEVYERGGVIAGSSAGAMVLGSLTRVFREPRNSSGPQQPDWDWAPGLALVPKIVVAPHFNRVTDGRLARYVALMPRDYILLGVDEHTAAVGDGQMWQVMGRGGVSVFHDDAQVRYEAGQQFSLP